MEHWRTHIERMGLLPLVGVCLDVLEPLSPLLGGALWVAQPALGVFMDAERVGQWATQLEDAGGIDRLRQELQLLNDD